MLCVVQGTVSIAGYTLWAGVCRLCMVGGRYIGRGVASNEAEEAVASSLFCVRTRARIGDVSSACAK